ncbi:FlaA1/EpsC-like NDP-sugar epimerase [Paenibacillus phyllosphaerae]|uniref:FlaA1/EpsC-like NDP-sugar epimerase n=1 Tax=Paenibacillus phyllosphaerae TaxID=274593 RepID=A0A7W5AXF5_9BACL|nr:nucleoside-diphosphate sugar epimerase/dehydratase [Paenibacillus phyllosphaerae]MBB3110570.1 FlaA1/EpsC-like NDP-sugar epimerase [Paenibacillus phyllosphaerae]
MRTRRRALLVLLLDLSIIWFSIVTSYLFRFDGQIPEHYFNQMIIYSVISSVISAATLLYFRLYSRLWQYASIEEILAIIAAVLSSWGISLVCMMLLFGERIPLSISMRTVETMLLCIGGTRFGWRLINRYRIKKHQKRKALIFGAGDCGVLIAKEIMNNPNSDLNIVGFIDDDIAKYRKRVFGISVLGNRDVIEQAVLETKAEEIIIAIPSAGNHSITDIINICKKTPAKVKIIPGLSDLISGKVSVTSIRDVDVEDLLGREPVRPDLDGIASYVSGKTVIVTGAGGSIGSELSRQIASFKPDKLLLLGHGENSIYSIEMELRFNYPQLALETIIADIQDRQRIDEVFRVFKPHVVFHAAAHKHVPLMERNPAEAVKNNVFGSKNVADAADKYGVDRFVLISSDKAVNPSSIMGATKRIAEMYIQSLDKTSKTKFAAVRFGNVLGSRGSVIPRFREQIASGGPVTVTHPDMVRYFMTIPEAVQLVIQAGAFAEGGEVFVLDMGAPVRILNLAEDVIRLSGFDPYKDIDIEFTGMREGEKLFEELLLSEEDIKKTKHDRIFIGQPLVINRGELELQFKRLDRAIGENAQVVREVIEYIVPLYKHVS